MALYSVWTKLACHVAAHCHSHCAITHTLDLGHLPMLPVVARSNYGRLETKGTSVKSLKVTTTTKLLTHTQGVCITPF